MGPIALPRRPIEALKSWPFPKAAIVNEAFARQHHLED